MVKFVTGTINLGIFTLMGLSTVAIADDVFSVCTALTRAPGGGLVTIRGKITVGTEQTFLAATGCPSKVRLAGRDWPAAIDLVAAEDHLDSPRLPVREDSIRRTASLLRQVREAEFMGIVELTLKGSLQLKVPGGTGHLNSLPAKLYLVEVSSAEVTWTKDKNPLWKVPIGK